jgi:hypothetical protein
MNLQGRWGISSGYRTELGLRSTCIFRAASLANRTSMIARDQRHPPCAEDRLPPA